MIEMVLLVLGIVGALIALFLIQFYRDPKRTIPSGNVIVSPADGKVIKILRIDSKSTTIRKGVFGKVHALTKDVAKECYVVSIFMSPFDAHYNRAPIAGTITSIKHERGKFLAVNTFENGLQNENNQVLITAKSMRVKVIQIAGLLARRIRCDVSMGQHIEKGQKIGMIMLGSQATLIMPATVAIAVKEGDRVHAGSSVIARVK